MVAYDWQIAVFGMNEADRIAGCLNSIIRSAKTRRVLITVVLNGTTDASLDAILAVETPPSVDVEVYRIEHADKSNAINRFFFGLLKPARHYCCVDAYVFINDSCFSFLEAAWGGTTANGLTGYASNGRTQKMRTELYGSLRGALYSLRPSFIRRMVDGGYKLPVGLYRGDGLLGAMAALDLNPVSDNWVSERIATVPGVTYEIASLSVYRPSHVARQLSRRVRQMRGRIENAAIKSITSEHGFDALPPSADDMVCDYIKQSDTPRVGLKDALFMRLAVRKAMKAHPPSEADLVPTLIHQRGASAEARAAYVATT